MKYRISPNLIEIIRDHDYEIMESEKELIGRIFTPDADSNPEDKHVTGRIEGLPSFWTVPREALLEITPACLEPTPDYTLINWLLN